MVQMKMIESDSEKKRREWMERANMFEAEARKYKDEYSKICDILKSKINDTINSAVVRRWLEGIVDRLIDKKIDILYLPFTCFMI